MRCFARAFTVTAVGVILVLILLLCFVLINENIGESGYHSGKVLLFSYENGVFSGEIMGEKFALSTALPKRAMPISKSLTLLLPPPMQLVLIAVVSEQ